MANRLIKILFNMRVVTRLSSRLKYRYYSFCIAFWAKEHFYFRIVNDLLVRVHKRTRFKLVKNITFRLSFKVFYLCNFCFERYGFFLIR
ncbi:hypothetical protein DXF97_30265, partial [Klebsiella pneumoniae]